jgi:hypothetical protein
MDNPTDLGETDDDKLIEEVHDAILSSDRRRFDQLPEYRKNAARQRILRIQRQHERIMEA